MWFVKNSLKNCGDIVSSIKNKEDYRLFHSEEESDKWGMMHYGSWGEKYKQIMRIAESQTGDPTINGLEFYLGNDYRNINEYLVLGDNVSRDSYLQSRIDIITIALCSAPQLDENIISFKYIDMSFAKQIIADNKKYGGTKLENFFSTSLLFDYVTDHINIDTVILKIYIHKGVFGIYANCIRKRDESEFLIQRNSYLRIIKKPYFNNKRKFWIIECEIFNLIL